MPKIRTQINVEMDALGFTNNPHITLITEGVCTCIAFIVRGKYWDDERDEKINFGGLFHWSGFGISNRNKDLLTQEALAYFLKSIRTELKLSSTTPVEINTLKFIGGEAKEFDQNNEVTLEGTEAEVISLIKTVQQFDFKHRNFILYPDAIEHSHFLTKGDQSITIKVTPYYDNFYIDPGVNEELDSQVTTHYSP
ncbi:Uncharacterised protein [Legionella steigerwaltii]|uniref:Uncharacterized protein n=1 Tax=Legionella steigerwaltii TaxID=460 RepID=A0A378L5A6_9GAMM|nr:hypothetical protein [Legionella steigerwaltii]KTD72127.1 hypothetical protein Lstg_2638 [Legionella steigerwaltii]STY21887.1 Uncharacterised protein [Legionella steigerwaltii]